MALFCACPLSLHITRTKSLHFDETSRVGSHRASYDTEHSLFAHKMCPVGIEFALFRHRNQSLSSSRSICLY